MTSRDRIGRWIKVPGALVLGAAVFAGCDRRAPSPALYQDAMVSIDATNDNWRDVDLFALRGDARYRIAHLSAFETMAIEIAPTLLVDQELTIQVRTANSGESYTTNPLTTHGRTRIEFRIGQVLSESSWLVIYLDEDEGEEGGT